MLKLKTGILTEKGKSLEQVIGQYIDKLNGKILFRGLGKKRPVFLSKYIEATKNRTDPTRRFRCFPAALEIIKKVKEHDLIAKKRTHLGVSYEFQASTKDGTIVKVHIREEVVENNRRLFLISTFWGRRDIKK